MMMMKMKKMSEWRSIEQVEATNQDNSIPVKKLGSMNHKVVEPLLDDDLEGNHRANR